MPPAGFEPMIPCSNGIIHMRTLRKFQGNEHRDLQSNWECEKLMIRQQQVSGTENSNASYRKVVVRLELWARSQRRA